MSCCQSMALVPCATPRCNLSPNWGQQFRMKMWRWIYAGDYARALDTDWGREYGERGDDRFKSNNPIVSRGGSLEIHVAIDPVPGTPVIPVSQTLQDVIDQHKARGNPGHFQLLTRTMRPDAVVTALQMTSSVSIPLRFSTGNEI